MMNIQDLIKKIGGPSYLAKRLGISHSAVVQWEVLPVKRLLEVERITGIPREELRPDIFKRERVEG